MDVLSLAGRTAVITGAGNGIGAATARTFAAAGAQLALLDRDAAGVTRTAEEIALSGGEALSFVADVTDAFAVERLFDRVAEEWGRFDILVNNAGIVRDAVLEDVTDEDWDATLDVNLRGAMRGHRAALPHMLRSRLRPHPLRLLARGPHGELRTDRLCREQGRHHRDDPGVGARARAQGHHGQRGRPGLHRHGHGEGHPRQGGGAGPGPHPRRADWDGRRRSRTCTCSSPPTSRPSSTARWWASTAACCSRPRVLPRAGALWYHRDSAAAALAR